MPTDLKELFYYIIMVVYIQSSLSNELHKEMCKEQLSFRIEILMRVSFDTDAWPLFRTMVLNCVDASARKKRKNFH